MAKKIYFGRIGLLLSAVLICFTGCARKKSFVIYHFGDVRGLYWARKHLSSGKKVGGYASLKNILNAEKKDYLLLSNGNWFLGTPEGSYGKGLYSADFMNMVRVDASSVGGMDFAFGTDNIHKISQKAKFAILACNLYDRKMKKPAKFTTPFVIKEINGIKTGIFGLMGRFSSARFLYNKMGRYEIKDEIESARKMVERLKSKGAIFIVALAQMETKSASESIDGESLAKQVEGIDVIICGGSAEEAKIPFKVENTLILKSAAHLTSVGRLELEINSFTGKLAGYNYKSIDLDAEKSEEDQKILNSVNLLRYNTNKAFGKKIAFAPQILKNNGGRSDLANWICDCLRRWAKVSAVIINCKNLKNSIPAGDVSRRTFYDIFPFDSKIVFVKIKGSDLKQTLEKSIPPDDLQVSGLEIYFDPTKPAGEKIVKVYVEGLKLEENKIYKIAIADNMLYENEIFYSLEFANTYESIRDKLLWCAWKENVLKIPTSTRWIEIKSPSTDEG